MDIIGVVSNVIVLRPARPFTSLTIGIFDTATISSGISKETSKVAFLEGSSQQGKALLASVDSNWVAARNFSLPFMSVYWLL